ncbi:hypothetical protein RR48_04004 [Papilio machaon]|uniref:Uncharacterized protein n=1 Tax=Papilio machaon TaxID=76193 RepID=A0A0N1PIS3_PAPMA|nr:hypothetical protein RR48_04004 [Papilio machaon]
MIKKKFILNLYLQYIFEKNEEISSSVSIWRFRVKLEELNLTLSIKSEEITPPLNPSRVKIKVSALAPRSATWHVGSDSTRELER